MLNFTKFKNHKFINELAVGIIGVMASFTIANLNTNTSVKAETSKINNLSALKIINNNTNDSLSKSHNLIIDNSKPKHVKNNENINGTATTVSKKYIVNNKDYGFYYNMKPIYNEEHAVRGNASVAFEHPIYLHYAHYTHYRFGRPFGDPQSMTILPDGRMYVLFNAGHSDSTLNRILEYNIKNKKLEHIGSIFKAGHGQGLSYDYKAHRLLLCVNKFIPDSHGILKNNLFISHISEHALTPYGKLISIKPSKNLPFGNDFACDSNGNFYNVAKYGSDYSYSPYGGLLIYRGNSASMKLNKLLFHSPNSTVQNIQFNPLTKRIYIIGNNCITSFPVNKLKHLENKDIKVSIFNNPVEFEDLAFYHKRAYLLLNRPSRILVSNKVF